MNNSKVFLRIMNNGNKNKVIFNNQIFKSVYNYKNIINNQNNNKLLPSLSKTSLVPNQKNNIKYKKSFFSTNVNEKKDETKNQQEEIKKDEQSLLTEQKEQTKVVENKVEENKVEENKEGEKKENEGENKENENNQQQQQQQQEEKPKTFKEKVLSKLKWTLIIGSITGSIGFLFYESYLRNTLPYKMTMNRLDRDTEVLRSFGGHITGIKWYKCFGNPIFGWVQNDEGNMSSWTYLRIPITRYVAPPLPKPKEGEPEIIPIALPEDSIFKGYDRGAQVGVVYCRMIKRSANFYDWDFEDLQVHCDNNQIIKIVDEEKNKIKIR